MSPPPLGAHVSVAGGPASAFARGREIGCESLQIFVKNASRWQAKPIPPDEAEAFRKAHAEAGPLPLVAHAAYLINLAATDAGILERSRAALADECRRCALLGVPALVVHPGAHLGAGEEAGLAAVAASLDAVDEELGACPTRILLELTAGQGTVLGSRLEQLATARARSRAAHRLGYCLDTCHAFAAGYELGSATAAEEFLAAVDHDLGFDLVECVHLNDSTGERGSHRDRHANIGAGRIGLEGFRRLLAEPALARVPMILETPLGDDEQGHARDLATLRELAGVSRRRSSSKRRTRGRSPSGARSGRSRPG
jgi:deoxyribonuclease IV